MRRENKHTSSSSKIKQTKPKSHISGPGADTITTQYGQRLAFSLRSSTTGGPQDSKGKALHLDSPTENRSRLSFARICIEVDLNCDFPKSALFNLGNDKFTTVITEYPWVPHSCSHCKVYGRKTAHCPISKATKIPSDISGGNGGERGNTSGTKVDSDASLLMEVKQVKDSTGHQKDLVKDPVRGVDSIIESIIVHPRIIPPASPDQVEANGGDASINTFECLNLCEDSNSLDGGDLASTSYQFLETAEYSDTSPICDTFKLVKRIDELDYSPMLPLSKSKLKRLKKQRRASNHVDGKKVTNPHD